MNYSKLAWAFAIATTMVLQADFKNTSEARIALEKAFKENFEVKVNTEFGTEVNAFSITNPLKNSHAWNQTIDGIAKIVRKSANGDKDLINPLNKLTDANNKIINTFKLIYNAYLTKKPLSKEELEKVKNEYLPKIPQLKKKFINQYVFEAAQSGHKLTAEQKNKLENEIESKLVNAASFKKQISSAQDKKMIQELISNFSKVRKDIFKAENELKSARFIYPSKKAARDILLLLAQKLEAIIFDIEIQNL